MAPGCAVMVWGLVFFITAADARSDDWPMLGHDAARSGGTLEEIKPPFARKWYRLFPEEGIQTGVQPVIAEGTVFLGTLGGVLHAIDSETGKDAWQYPAGAPILHAAAANNGRVFFGTADGSVHAVHCRNGKGLWRRATGAAVWNAPAVHGGMVFIGSRDGRLYALDEETGRIRWSADLGAPILNSPGIDAQSGRVCVGSEAMRVHAFRLRDGQPIWTSEPLPGSSMRGYHPVIAPDGSVMVTTAPVISYDRFQELLLEMVRSVFGDFASWRHNQADNDRLRAENFRQMENPATYPAQIEFLRQRLAAESQFQTFFVLDGESGRQRFVAPIVASESMNGPGAPPLVTRDGRIIVKYQVLLRSRYEHYSPFLNVGYLDTRTGHIEPIMDQTRTYGWHDSLLLVHDEQCQLSFAGGVLINTHQDNVNALDLRTLKGFTQPWALNIHEPAPGEALSIRAGAWRGKALPPGAEWLIRGTAVYGGGSVIDVPVAIANGTFYYLPSHELNSGCALIAYRSTPEGADPKRVRMPDPRLTPDEWEQVQAMPWDWDTLSTPRLTNLLASLPAPVPGTTAAPLSDAARTGVAPITDGQLDEQIWSPAFDPASVQPRQVGNWQVKLQAAVDELIKTRWRPFVTPASKAPEHAYRFFTDPAETLYTLMLARPLLAADRQTAVDDYVSTLLREGRRSYPPGEGTPRESYRVASGMMRVVDEPPLDELGRLYPLWLWSRTPAGARFIEGQWKELRRRSQAAAAKNAYDCGNARVAGLIACCRLAKSVGDLAALDETLPLARQAMRERLTYELAHTRGGVIGQMPTGRSAFVRWRHLTPDVARLLGKYAGPVQQQLMAHYVDRLRPAWWMAWNAEQLMRNEAPCQLPDTPMEIFAAKALILRELPATLSGFVDLPWCKGDEYYIRKLALGLLAATE